MSLLLDALKQAEDNKKKANAELEPAVVAKPASGLTLSDNEAPSNHPAIEISLAEQEPTPVQIEAETNEAGSDRLSSKVEKPAKADDQHTRVPNRQPSAVDVLAVGQKKSVGNRYKLMGIAVLLLLLLAVASLYWLEQQQIAQDQTHKELMAAKKQQAAAPLIAEKTPPLLADQPIPLQVSTRPKVEDKSPVQPFVKPPPIVRPDDKPAIVVTKSRQSSELLKQLKAAYAALLRRDMDRAQLLYQQVLDDLPKQLDALLGLAHIASQQHDMPRARALYEKVLRLDEANHIAQIGVLQTYSQQDPIPRQQVLEALVAKQPANAESHLALGHALSEQGKWAAAQKAYFKAYSLNPSNTVMAYNLAVSLDSLGQFRAAETYYETALVLNDKAVKPLNLEQVSNRLKELRQSP